MKYFARTDFTNILPVQTENSGIPWQSGLIFSPNNYSYSGTFLNMMSDGVYFIVDHYGSGFDGGQRIVYGGDIPRFMSSIAWVTRYGASDESMTSAQLASKARERSVALLCGRTVDFAMHLCSQVGITARKVHMLTANTAPDPVDPMFVPYTDGLDEGHVLIEVMLSTGWALFDVAGDVAFKDANGKYMSMAEVVDAGVDNCELVQLAPSDSMPINWSSTSLAAEAWHNIRLRNHSDKWRRGIYQIMGVNSGGYVYYTLPPGKESRESWVLGLSPGYRVVNRSTFNSMFYS